MSRYPIGCESFREMSVMPSWCWIALCGAVLLRSDEKRRQRNELVLSSGVSIWASTTGALPNRSYAFD